MTVRTMTGAEMIVKALVDQGVEAVFGYPGGAVLPIYDEIFKQNRLRHYLVRQEGGAVHAAEGYARSTGKVGVVLVTSGPGATNAVTGLTDALMDSIPVVCLTGQVPTHLIGNDAFQEADTTGITRPCTKHNYLIRSVDEVASTIHEAFYVARSGRPGPVVVDVPKDVQFAEGAYRPPEEVKHRSYKPRTRPDPQAVEEAVALIETAKRPVVYVGGGVINSGPAAARGLLRLVQETGFPCTQTLMGLGAFPASHPQSLGMLGMHGLYEANLAMHGADLILAVGARFDDRVTGLLSGFAPNAKKVHIDIDPSSINKNVVVDVPVVADAGKAIEAIRRRWSARGRRTNHRAVEKWWREIAKWRKRDCLKYEQDDKVIKPQYALERLQAKIAGRNDVFFTTEVGQHQMWAAQFLRFERPNHWMTSGGLGTMGYEVPAAMGAQFAQSDPIWSICGDGGFQMTSQELQTIAEHNLPVRFAIFNNQYLGMVRQWQELFYDHNYHSVHLGQPDFVKLAEAYGVRGVRASTRAEAIQVFRDLDGYDGPVVIDFRLEEEENVWPMVPAGAALKETIESAADL
jgi:acetolactate synthase-1/2/3 large subunit